MRRWQTGIVIALTTGLMLCGCGKGDDYKEAMSMYDAGNYVDAKAKFTELEDYEDSQTKVKDCDYELAIKTMDSNDYEEAIEQFKALGDYKDSENKIKACYYELAIKTMDSNDYEEAIEQFKALGDYNDSENKIKACNYEIASQKMKDKKYDEAITIFKDLGEYEDSKELINSCQYEKAIALVEEKNYTEAKSIFSELPDYKESGNYLNECDYNIAIALFDSQDYEGAIEIFTNISDYSDSSAKIEAANQKIMYRDYGDVIKSINGKSWFCNGGAINSVSQITFSQDKIKIESAYFDKNGIHSSGSGTYSYTINSNAITVDQGKTNMVINYTVSGGSVTLDSKKYLTEKQVLNGVSGVWKYSFSGYIAGIYCKNESYISILSSGRMTIEKASVSAYESDAYYYYGPYSGSFTIGPGYFNTSVNNGNSWFYGINSNGTVSVYHYATKATHASYLPGEDGYYHLCY